jgi:hypothetical protein
MQADEATKKKLEAAAQKAEKDRERAVAAAVKDALAAQAAQAAKEGAS